MAHLEFMRISLLSFCISFDIVHILKAHFNNSTADEPTLDEIFI